MKFLKGLNRDTNPVDQPPGTWRYARNIVVPPGSGTIQTEKGTERVVNVTAGFTVIGSCLLPDEKVCLFLTWPGTANQSRIGIYDPVTDIYTTVYSDSSCTNTNKLDFRIEFPIQAESKMDITGKISVYWTDDYNPMRYIKLYDPPTCPHPVEDFDIFPQLSELPYPELDRLQSGVLTVGAYALTFALLDDEGTPTNYLAMSNWVYITPNTSPESSASGAIGANPQSNISMGFVGNLDGHATMSYQGGPTGTAGAKGIIFKISNLDPRYSFIRPCIIKREGGVLTAHRLQDLDYDTTASTEILISYTGNEITEAETIENVLIPRETYSKAKTVAQVDDTLYWGNLEKSKIDIGYQPYAMGIEIHASQSNDSYANLKNINGISVDMDINRPDSTNAMRDSKDKYFYTGYQRDEVYAFYITWITIDGNETVAYHIPGRPPLDLDDYAGTGLKEDDLACLTVNDVPYMDAGGGSDNQLQHMGQNNPATATVQIGDLTTHGATLANSNNMGYWGNKTETYPVDDSYNGLDHTGAPISNLQYGNGTTPVRHHHMPSACIGEGGGHPFGGNAEYYSGKQKLNPLAIKVTNIPFPSFMLGKVLGYRIYYAKRTEGNSLVADTGILSLMPSQACKASNNTWGSCNSNNWGNSFMHPLNGFDVYGYHCGGSFGSNAYNGSTITKDYALNPPPGGVDYANWSGNYDGGRLVAYPFSCVHAPYSDVEHSSIGLDRQTYEPRGNHFSFNGLHTRMMDPDISNVSYIKVQRHFQIGRPDSTNAMTGAYFIRKDTGGSLINSNSGNDEDRMYILFDWTQHTCKEYDDLKTYGTLYNTGEVGGSAAQSCGPQYPYFRAVGAAINIAADTTIEPPNSPAGEVINAGGCQTTYLYTYNDIYTHDISTFMMNYYGYQVYKLLTAKQSYTHNNPDFNYPYLRWGMHNCYINMYDQAQGAGTWAFKEMSIQTADYGGKFSGTDNTGNWQNGWCQDFDTYFPTNSWTLAHFITTGIPWMDADPWTPSGGTTGNYLYSQTFGSDQDDTVIQYMAYGGIHRIISDIYAPFDLQQDLVFTGFQRDTSAITAATTINDSTKIFGGDTYIDYYCETRSMRAPGYAWPGDGPAPTVYAINSANAFDSDHYDQDGRYIHYVYGLMGDIWLRDGMHEDTSHALYITESKANIHMRYSDGQDNEDFFPLKDIQDPDINVWKAGPRLFSYNTDYDAKMNVRPVVAFNHLNKVSAQSDFPTRIIRSVPHNQSGLTDSFRMYNSAQYRDLPRHRGELWNLAVFENVLLPQTERTLLKTRGKETLKTGESGAADVTELALGDGNLFKHDPSEVLYTSRGHAGTTSQYAVVTCKYGHFSVDKQAGKVFLLGEKLEEISALGMREFLFRRLTTWGLTDYGMPTNLDIPTAGLGIIASWDPEYERFVLTKRDYAPTTSFTSNYNTGSTPIVWDNTERHYKFSSTGVKVHWTNTTYFTPYSWTISYYPALKFWGSLHDFTPTLYFYTSEKLYSMNEGSNHINVHNYEDTTSPYYNIATYYGTDYDVVFEYISNVQPDDNKKYTSFYYTVDVEEPSNQEEGARVEVQDPGFDTFYVYNSRQMSRGTPFIVADGQYNLIQTTANIRRKERTWYCSDFRDDMEQTNGLTSTMTTGTPGNILTTNYLTSLITINSAALDLTKDWNERRKFVDKWMAVRLIMNTSNITSTSGKNLVTLHSADAAYKPTYR